MEHYEEGPPSKTRLFSRPRLTVVAIAGTALLLILLGAGVSTHFQQTADLQETRDEVAALEKQVAHKEEERSGFERDLQEAKERIAQLRKDKRKANAKVTAANKQLAALREEIDAAQPAAAATVTDAPYHPAADPDWTCYPSTGRCEHELGSFVPEGPQEIGSYCDRTRCYLDY